MNLSMVPSLSTLRFAGLKPAATPLAFSALAPASDVFFASTVRFGKWQPTTQATNDKINDYSLFKNPLNGNQFIAIVNNLPVGTITRNQKIKGFDKVNVEFFRTKDGYSVATTAKTPDGKEIRFVNAAGSTLSINGVNINLFPMGIQPTPLLPEVEASQKAALNVQTPATQTIVKKAYIPIVGVGERLERILKQVGGSYKPELELVPGESIINKLIGHYAESGIEEFFIPVTDVRLPYVQKAWNEFKTANPKLANIKVHFEAEEGKLDLKTGKKEYKTGTAGPLVKMINKGLININEPLFVAMGDHAVQPTLDIATLIQTFADNGLDGALLGVEVGPELYERYGMVETKGEPSITGSKEIAKFIEKPKGDVAKELVKTNPVANTAIFVLGAKGLNQLVEIKKEIDKPNSSIPSVDGGIDFSTHLWQPNAEKPANDPSKLMVHGMGQPVKRWVDIGNVGTFMDTVRRIANGELYGPSETAKTRASIDEKTGAIYYQGCKEAAAQSGLTFEAKGNTMVIAN